MIILSQFILSAISIIGFSVLFNIPKRSIPKAGFAGGLGWVTYVHFYNVLGSSVGATFLGACVVAIISEIFARSFKEAVTVFVIPAIIPLVPGSGMYYTMISIINKDYVRFAAVANETLFIAGSISVALLIVSSITRITVQLKNNYNKNRG